MELNNLTVLDIVKLIKTKQIKVSEIVKHYLDNIQKYKDKNAVLEVFDDIDKRVEELESLVDSGAELPKLIGVPVLIKDNFLYQDKICSCCSLILKEYKAQYTATAVQKLLDEGAIILGRTNMDEFAMGGSCERSAFGPCKNAYDDTRVSGGSSGGSAVAVAIDMCAFALGSDTGGSVRQPASYNGVVGLKPTYSRISRYGLVAFADALDCVGFFTKNIEDNAYILSILSGRDEKDMTSSKEKIDDYLSSIRGSIKGKNIAIIKEVQELVAKTEYVHVYENIVEFCKQNGANINIVSIPEYPKLVPVYYIIAFAEASSNLGRYDGIKYTSLGSNITDLNSVYLRTRSELLGKEVKRRIMLGNFVLSSDKYNSYYLKAKKIAQKVKKQFENIFKDNDLVFCPTACGEAFELGAKTSDPVSMYIEDVFTVCANMIGAPAISIPIAKGVNGLPIGLQILSKHFNESEIFNMADFILKGVKR